jgi:hypothetical protein
MGASIVDRFESEIRDLAAKGCTDPEIAVAVGVSESAIWQARRKWGIAPRPRGGRHRPVLAAAPAALAGPATVASGQVTPAADEKFALAMAGRLFESIRVKPARRLTLPRPDPAAGLGVSSAWSAMEMGARWRE